MAYLLAFSRAWHRLHVSSAWRWLQVSGTWHRIHVSCDFHWLHVFPRLTPAPNAPKTNFFLFLPIFWLGGVMTFFLVLRYSNGNWPKIKWHMFFLLKRELNSNLIKVVVNAPTINGLRQQSLKSVPWNFVGWQISTALGANQNTFKWVRSL